MSEKLFRLKYGAFEMAITCKSEKTKNGFKHTAVCVPVANCKHDMKFVQNMYYYNRTWESFEFESILLNCVNVLIKREVKSMQSEFMRVNGYKRLTQGRKAVLQELLNNWYRYNDLAEIKEMIKRGEFE